MLDFGSVDSIASLKTMFRKRGYIIATLVATLITLTIIRIEHFKGAKMIDEYTPVIDNTIEIKYEGTLTYLLLEKSIWSDPFVKIDTSCEHINQAECMHELCLSGREVNNQLKQIDSHYKIILASCFSKCEHMNELNDTILSGFFSKHYRAHELSKIIFESMLQNKKSKNHYITYSREES